MNYALKKINSQVSVESVKTFMQLLSKLDSNYFENNFYKSKTKYLEDMQLLFEQIQSDYHYVYVLKRKTHVFQLQWKESVLKAHLDLLIPNIPVKYIVTSAVVRLEAI